MDDDIIDLVSSSDELPDLVDPDPDADVLPTLRVLQKWDQIGHPIRALMESIEMDPLQHVLDPHSCVPNCPFGSGTLECQRYVLLKRLYQIQLQLDKRRMHRRTPSLENKLEAYLNSVC